MELLNRSRRLRTSPAIRAMVQENSLSVNDFIVPLFVQEGSGVKSEIPSMPGYYRYSLDTLTDELNVIVSLGLKSVLVFVKVGDELKDNTGKEAYNSNGFMQQTIKHIKSVAPQLFVMTDVALDPYSIVGHDGIVADGKIVNDPTVEALCKMAVSHAAAGADMVAPSDMMDGRILALRIALDEAGFEDVGIMSYAAKYASSFYGPFREALDSAPVDMQDIPKDKKTYQMDPANRKEAIKEVLQDVDQGADIIMVKPGMPYLDIVRDTSNEIEQPISVYQVSGEYAMIKAASANGWLNEKEAVYESLIAFKRAGASLIASYFAKDVAKWLNEQSI
ncbi:MAG: porphobilinogen synthase [Flavobacteriales bacterium]|nr:porphobilinogen synthase [Flavobacteriales bacterium]MCB9195470.1 porphobilinogen synthase [Flavobacteriales bacterium]MCB9198374.1 porphobilinogen synthase [Flavobacteriales bacterium]